MGGSIPGSVGFMYARTNDPAPSNGKYAKKTMASAQNGTEMEYYQNGLDWKPRSMDDGGEVVPGENEELQIPSAWDDKMASIKKTRLRGPGTRTRFMPPQLLDEDQFEVEDVNYDQLSAPHFVNSLTPVESKNYIPKMQDRFTDMENMYYTKNAEFNENWSNLNLLDESSNKIKLNTGRFTGAKVPTNIIDELAKTSRKQNVSLGQLLTLMGRESMFGSGTDRNEDRAGSKTSLMSGWNVAEDYQPYNNIRFLADNKVPGVKPTPTPHGYEYEITDERAMNNYLKKNPKLLDQYKAKLDSTKVLGDQDAFDLAAKFLKKKGIKGYNPGDPRYEEMFQKDYDTLKQDKALMSYLKKKGYKYEQGGEMRYYQEGLDFKPKSISKNGSNVIKDDRGQWDHPGEITEIGSNQITMQGVPYPVMGISDTGDIQMMYPDEEYQYDGNSVTEIPMMREGGTISKKTLARNQRIAQSNAAQNQPLTPESLATRAIAIPDKLRLSEQMRNISPELASWMEENPTMSYIDENLNPLVIAGKLASKLGQVPLNVKQGNYRQALLNTISPMLVRASAAGAATTDNLSNSKNKFEQGGQLTKLDQLTNFTNYNTKQPGGWLDKYQ